MRVTLNAAAAPVLSLHGVYVELADIPDGDDPARAVVVPPPGAGGVLPTRDGRKHWIPDAAAAAAAMNAQDVRARIDFDHKSEPTSPTFGGSTAAEGGWLRDFRAQADGSISALLDLSSKAREALREKLYGYLSPALLLDESDGNRVLAMSSLALVNNPNMALGAPAVHAGAPSADDREQALAQREGALAQAAVDRAAEQGRLPAPQKDFALNAIRAHAGGVAAGIAAFDAAYAEPSTGGPDASRLTSRVGPRGKPDARAGSATVAVPPGHVVDAGRLELHARIQERVKTAGVSYSDALLALGAEGAL